MARFKFHPAAEDDLREAAEWYDEQAGLGEDFVDEVRRGAGKLSENPRIYQLVPGTPRRLKIRACPIERFPYSLFFVQESDHALIVAVAHQRRKPRYWRKRMTH